MPFVELDPDVCLRAIEGYQNELEPEVRALDAFYRQFCCKKCRSPVTKEFVPGHVFNDPNTSVPRATLRCTRCGCHFDPHSNLIISMGDPSLAVLRPDDE